MTVIRDDSATLAGTDDGDSGNSNYDWRIYYAPGNLSAATGNQLRVTILFGTSCPSYTPAIDSIYVGQAGASPPNFAGDQVQIKFGGSASCNSSAAGVVVSDFVTLAQTFDNTKGYIIAFHSASTATNISGSIANPTGPNAYNGGTTNSASQTTVTGFTSGPNTAWYIEKIEVQASGDTFANNVLLHFV